MRDAPIMKESNGKRQMETAPNSTRRPNPTTSKISRSGDHKGDLEEEWEGKRWENWQEKELIGMSQAETAAR